MSLPTGRVEPPRPRCVATYRCCFEGEDVSCKWMDGHLGPCSFAPCEHRSSASTAPVFPGTYAEEIADRLYRAQRSNQAILVEKRDLAQQLKVMTEDRDEYRGQATYWRNEATVAWGKFQELIRETAEGKGVAESRSRALRDVIVILSTMLARQAEAEAIRRTGPDELDACEVLQLLSDLDIHGMSIPQRQVIAKAMEVLTTAMGRS